MTETLHAMALQARNRDWTNADLVESMKVVVAGCWIHGFGSILMEARPNANEDGVRAWTRSRVRAVQVGRETEWLECTWSDIPPVDAAVEAHTGIVPQHGLVSGPERPKRDTTGEPA